MPATSRALKTAPRTGRAAAKNATKSATNSERRGRGKPDIAQLIAQAAGAARLLKLLGNEYRLLILCLISAKAK